MKSIIDLPNVFFNYYFIVGGLFIAYLIYRTFNSLIGTGNFIQIKYKTRGHTWRSIQCHNSIPYNIYCSVCLKLMLPLDGLYCECCAISSCKLCCKHVDKKVKCKELSWRDDKPFPHLWVNVGFLRGETDQNDDSESYKNYFCSWCHRIVNNHELALYKSKPCDFQKYKNIIIPPYCVKIEKHKIINVINVNDDDWNPLVIFANRKSGSNRSDEVLSMFRGLLNPLQVIDIGRTAPEAVVRWLPPKCRILVAGGDGTIGWILNALHMAPHIKASVGILPMGTGNDLSRALGWGATCDSVLDADSIVHSLFRAVEMPLDRWKVTIIAKRSLGRLRGPRVLYAHNYASIGVDAQVALDFHRAREQFLYRFANQTLNYMAYLVLGVGRALDDGGCYGLERRIRVYAPAQLTLPPVQALVALNIPSWGAGVDLWSMGSEDVAQQSMSDGKLEVVGISSSFHIARLQCGLAEPFRFTQAQEVRIELEGSCAMQVDGEPWMQGPATIWIQHAGQSHMLVPS